MTCVGVFIGQCGVTIGYELLKTQPSCMQRLDGLSHAIFIDAEQKVTHISITYLYIIYYVHRTHIVHTYT